MLVNYWNGNGSLWSLLGLLHDVVGYVDLLVVIETHETPARPLPGYTGYQWLSICREEVCASSGVRGSGGVACLIRDDLFSTTTLVLSHAHARFMWIWVGGTSHCQRDIFIFVCYIPPTFSPYVIHSVEDENPFTDLFESISKSRAMGDIIVLGDFKPWTKDL